MVKSLLEFHSVGQGLFYSGIIRSNTGGSYVFVYDCGSKQNELHDEIDKFKKMLDKNTIDLLVISHFHDDHVNGIPHLLDGLKVNAVVLQNLSEKQRLVNYLHYRQQIEKEDSELAILISNPIGYFKNLGVKKIILVSSDNEHNEHKEQSNIFESIREDLDKNHNKVNFGDDNNLIKISSSDIIHEEDNGNIIYTKNNIRCENSFWEFCFSCDVAINSKIDQVIDTHLNNGLKIEDVLRDENEIKCLIKKFRINKVKLNESSMILVHHPIHFNNYCFRLHCDNMICDKFLHWECCNRCCVERNIAPSTVLTGDIVLNKDFCHIIKEFFETRIPLIFQVPHHGSKSNSEHCIDDINKFICSIIPCGYMHRHPSKYIYDSLDNPYIVDMYENFKYRIMCS